MLQEATERSRDTAGSRSYATAGALGAVLAGVVFAVVLMNGHFSLLQATPAGDFYDLQAHSLLGLHWDVPRRSLAVEGFLVHGKVYMYFGPLPALLRLPIAAFTNDYDGRLGQISMLVALAVALTFTVRLAWRIRPLIRGSAPVTRGEQWAVGVFTFVVGGGSVLVYLASRAWVYHEATLWGVALALGAFEFVIAFALQPNRRNLILASALTSACVLSRAVIGLGPLAALGLLLLACLWSPLRRWVGMVDERPPRSLLFPLFLAMVIPVALYAYVNYSKFGTLFSLPNYDQFQNAPGTRHRRMLEANGGSFFSVKFLPTTALQYARPDAVAFRSLFPWVTVGSPSPTIGNVMNEWTYSSSYTACMPALTALGVIGFVGLLRPGRNGSSSVAALRAPVIGALFAAVITLSYAFINQRYLSDFMPLAILVSLVGLHVLLRWTSDGRARRALTRTTWVGLSLLIAMSVWVNVGLAVYFERALDADGPALPAFVKFQYRIHDLVPGGSAPYVRAGDELPAPRLKDQGTAFIVGRCEGLYWSSGFGWRVLERGVGGGHLRFRARFPASPTGWEPLVVSGRGDDAQYLVWRVLPGHRVQVAYNRVFAGKPIRVQPDRSHEVDVVMDAQDRSSGGGTVSVTIDGEVAWSTILPNPIIRERLQPLTQVTVGHADLPGVAPRFTGTLEPLPVPTPLCRKLAPHARE